MQYPLSCPKCGKKFKLTVQDESKLLAHNFMCNKCGFQTPFVNMLPHLKELADKKNSNDGSGAFPATHISSNATAATGPKTHIAQPHTGNNDSTDPNAEGLSPVKPANGSLPVYFEVDKTKRKLWLRPGSFILGRDSNDSCATIKVASDPYMSRQCAKLDVKLSHNSVRLDLTPLKSKNQVYINNVPLSESETKALRLGDKVLLGSTTITLKINR